MNAAQPPLAAIAVTHDSAHVLPEWLDAFEADGRRALVQLCVVDSGSSAEQLEATRELAGARADAFVSLPNVGYGMACNAGAAATRARTLLFSNPDVRVLSLPTRALDERGLGDALLGGFATEPDRPLGFVNLPGWSEEAQELALGRWSHAFERSVDAPAWVSGAALMIDRDAFERIGGFSPAFFMYFEDADLCARHSLAGGHVELDPDLLVSHGFGKSTEEARRESLGASLDSVNRFSGRRFAARYGQPWQQASLYLLLALFYLPRRVLREHMAPGEALDYAACLLRPRRALHKLGAQRADISPMTESDPSAALGGTQR